MTEQTLIIAILVALVILWITETLGMHRTSRILGRAALSKQKKIHRPTKTAAAYRSGCSLFCYSFMRQMRIACFSTLKRTSV